MDLTNMKKLIALFIIVLPSIVSAQYQIDRNETVVNKRIIALFAADVTDGITPETGLTITCTRKLPAATTFSACTNATVVEVGSGVYQYTIDATELTAEGTSVYLFTNNAMLPSRVPVQIRTPVRAPISIGR